MNKIIICCSISVAETVIKIKGQLEDMGFNVEIPYGVQKYIDNGNRHISSKERAKDKKDLDLITRYYEKIKEHDAVMVVNEEKNGIVNYIGGNTFLEIGFAHVLGKPIYLLNSIPDCSYRDELEAMNMTVLNGDIDSLRSLLA